jgi:hypothetical protein
MTSRVLRYSSLIVLMSASLCISGCSAGTGVSFPTSPKLAQNGGRAMGGELPIIGATITMYSSAVNSSIASGAYVGTSAVLGTTTSDSHGNFGFTGVTGCSTSQIVFITSAGGNNGAGTNANILNVAVLGFPTDTSCDGLPSFTVVNEVTTVATAYAFSSFLSISGSAVNITAPANNDSLATTNSVSGGTVTTASGLLHAYQNANNLANSTTGGANSAPPTNSSAIAPAAVVNTLANILQYCVNSTGGVEGDSTPCGNLFLYTPSQAGVFPTTTLQAAMYLARNPASNVSALFGLAPGTGAAPFLPLLGAAPKDWTLAIAYPVPPNPVSGVGFPFSLTLDADDNVYVTSPENDPWLATSVATSTTNSTSACLFGWKSNGAFRPTITPYSGTPGTPGTVGTGTPGTSNWFCSGQQAATTQADYLLSGLAADNAGNVWVSNYGTYNVITPSSSQNSIVSLSNTGQFVNQYLPQVTGAQSQFQTVGVIVDKLNNVWLSELSSSGTKANVVGLAAGGGNTSSVGATLTIGSVAAGPNSSPAPRGIAFDSGGNFFAASYGGSTGLAPALSLGGRGYVLTLNGAQSNAANYGTGANAPFETAVVGGSATSGAGNDGPYGVAVDSSSNVWFTAAGAPGQTITSGAAGLAKCAPNAGAPFTTASKASNTTCTTISGNTFTSPKFLEADGNKVLWIADSTGIVAYASGKPGFISENGGFLPCIPGNGSVATCTYPDNNSSTKGIAVDSTGSVWWTTPDLVTTNANANMLIQMIGTGTPTWPLLAVQSPGNMPQ